MSRLTWGLGFAELLGHRLEAVPARAVFAGPVLHAYVQKLLAIGEIPLAAYDFVPEKAAGFVVRVECLSRLPPRRFVGLHTGLLPGLGLFGRVPSLKLLTAAGSKKRGAGLAAPQFAGQYEAKTCFETACLYACTPERKSGRFVEFGNRLDR